MRSTLRQALGGGALMAVILLTGCGVSKAPSGSADIEEIHVTYQPNVHVIGAAEAKELILGISSNGMGILLDGKNPAAATYEAGDSLIVKGWLARKIIAADRTDDGSVMLLVQTAHLSDVVKDGRLQLRKPISFNGMPAAGAVPRTAGVLESLVPEVKAASEGGIRRTAYRIGAGSRRAGIGDVAVDQRRGGRRLGRCRLAGQ